ncbi:hypothetical protein L1987_01025 [Smallanthus sonchifolius]|uniref:Uncharacterized protein n=1 Tax=Smallanthus sonchifolius TaxID=185202 RepID=A0ACB9K3S9_9ASTR|nr:hypothetical protein L1987_01025 [Smallanthus sonchifolius]
MLHYESDHLETYWMLDGQKETKLIEEIVMEIHRRLGVPLSTTLPLLIGMRYDIKSITSWLTDGSCHSADILTVAGLGGIGKTSLVKYVFRVHCGKFHKSSFIKDINRRCTQNINGLIGLQKQLYGDISKKMSLHVEDVSGYTSMIGDALARKKVLVVLDDINCLDHLDALLGNKAFHPGSKIIITTKDLSLTERCELFNPQVQPKHTKILLKGLNEISSRELLCHHAFKCKDHIKEGYEDVSKKLVEYCEGYPLALEVLGRSLHKRDVAYWEECIQGLKKKNNSNITNVLQMSFDSLPLENDKELFKHIACFFVEKDRDLTETILKACKLNTESGITTLVERCLLSITLNNELTMHSLIQEMGRDLVRQESPEKPWKRSRLWCHKDSVAQLSRTQRISGDDKQIVRDLVQNSNEFDKNNSKLNNQILKQDFSKY